MPKLTNDLLVKADGVDLVKATVHTLFDGLDMPHRIASIETKNIDVDERNIPDFDVSRGDYVTTAHKHRVWVNVLPNDPEQIHIAYLLVMQTVSVFDPTSRETFSSLDSDYELYCRTVDLDTRETKLMQVSSDPDFEQSLLNVLVSDPILKIAIRTSMLARQPELADEPFNALQIYDIVPTGQNDEYQAMIVARTPVKNMPDLIWTKGFTVRFKPQVDGTTTLTDLQRIPLALFTSQFEYIGHNDIRLIDMGHINRYGRLAHEYNAFSRNFFRKSSLVNRIEQIFADAHVLATDIDK